MRSKKHNETRFIHSIQMTLAVGIGILIVTVIASIGILSYIATNRVILENTSESTLKMINQVNYDMDYYLRNVETTIEGLRVSDNVLEYFYMPQELQAEHTRNYLNTLLATREDLVNIYLITTTGEILSNDATAVIKETANPLEQPYYQKSVETGDFVISESHLQNIALGEYPWVITCSKAVYDGDLLLGVILIDLNFSLIEDMVSRISIGDQGYLFIIDDSGNLIYHPKLELIYSGIKTEPIEDLLTSNTTTIEKLDEEQAVNFVITNSEYTGWKVIGKIYNQDLNSYSDVLREFFIMIILVTLIISLVLAVMIAGNILRPVKSLLRGMSAFQAGDLNVQVAVESQNELGILTNTFNTMTRRIKTLIDTNKEVERLKRKSDLEALQAQINPHFLYNTLDSIVWMGEAGKSAEVVKMTSALSKLFRISISKGQEYITVKQELEHVESYLTIQKMRYGDKLDYTITAEENLLSLRIIKIIIQPIVENAIYHGLKKMPGKGNISVHVYKESLEKEDYLCIDVTDDGIGMEDATIEQLLSGQIQSEKKNGGVGVYNVDQRIKLYYGEEFGIQIQSEMFEGTCVTIRLPYVTGGDYDEKVSQ
ncbi:MAG: histidine kinase [Firmicutes bacterium HGW-Firmicutes-2]|jgi:two-component system sensor histidine kinase YesM|nr:MAG: histidine kinase [Firmicutes bacterium HGW-Firmicutes-2]